MKTSRTRVGIVGAGPAGLLLSHLLAASGIESIAIDIRSREEIETTHRAGILENGVVQTLVEAGLDRVLTEGMEHDGIDVRFAGESHPINFQELVNSTVWLYPQTDVFIDLANARERAGGDVRYGVSGTRVEGVGTDPPVIHFVDADGAECEIHCEIVAGADGSRSITRHLIPASERTHHFKEYPYAWFGVLTQSPFNAENLIYAHSDRGFALISQRTAELQRMCFQCAPDEDVQSWSDRRIWDELQARTAAAGIPELKEGPVLERTLLGFRSFVSTPMRWQNLVLAGDAAHTVPPTGAKGLNAAVNDIRILHECLVSYFGGDKGALESYSDRALKRIWKVENFSYWMTQMMHRPGSDNTFDLERQLGELETVTSSRIGQSYLAECYTGWPDQPVG